MQVRVISLGTPRSDLMQFMRTLSTDVAVQQGIDVRNVASESLVASQVISLSSANAIERGRKWHHEIPSKGAVGLAIANRLALAENTSIPLLLLEEDCDISKPEQFRNELNLLLSHIDEFDVAVFGAYLQYAPEKRAVPHPVMPANWVVLRGTFFMTHCVLYSPRGRRIVSEYLRNHPLEMQIDSLYGDLAKMNTVRAWAQHKQWSAVQRIGNTTMQNMCFLCYAKPIGIPLTDDSLRTWVVYTIVGCTLAWMAHRYRGRRIA